MNKETKPPKSWVAWLATFLAVLMLPPFISDLSEGGMSDPWVLLTGFVLAGFILQATLQWKIYFEKLIDFKVSNKAED